MLTFNNKPSQTVSRFRLRAGILMLILGPGLLILGTLAVRHTRGNVLLHKEILKRIQGRMEGVSGASFDSRSRELQRLNAELAFFETELSKYNGYFMQAVLILVGGILISSTGFCLLYLHSRNRRRLAYMENGLLSV